MVRRFGIWSVALLVGLIVGAISGRYTQVVVSTMATASAIRSEACG